MSVSRLGGPGWASSGPACDNQAAVSSLRNAARPRCPNPTAPRASGAPGPGLVSSSSSGPGPGWGHRAASHRWLSPGLLGCACVLHVLFLGPGHLWMSAGRCRAVALQKLCSQPGASGPEDFLTTRRTGQGRSGWASRAPCVQGCSGACEWRPRACSRGRSVCSQRPGLGLIRAGVRAGPGWVTPACNKP